MHIAIIGGAGFIGTNLTINLSNSTNDYIKVIDRDERYFRHLKALNLERVEYEVAPFSKDANFDEQIKGCNIVYHMASTVIPGNSNIDISEELENNVNVTIKLLDACVRQCVTKVVFISSGGAVYGKKGRCPVEENMVTYPITSYGIQKITIEKLLYLYRYQKGLDYRIIRLANPYGPYQRPNGQLGVVTTFIYKALSDGKLQVYGDGSVIRDFIYIDDAIGGIRKIVEGENEYRVFNLGSGKGTSVNEVIQTIKEVLKIDFTIEYIDSRKVDIPENYLDINRFEKYYGKLNLLTLKEGVRKTADFMVKSGMVKI